VARLASFVLRSIERYTRWVFAVQRSDELAADLERQVWIFLARLQQRGALAGKTPEQGCFVRASRPREDSGAPSGVAITLRVGFAPERPNELLTYDFRFRETTMTTDVVPVADAERRLG
jgi:phage tail sheath protein FI